MQTEPTSPSRPTHSSPPPESTRQRDTDPARKDDDVKRFQKLMERQGGKGKQAASGGEGDQPLTDSTGALLRSLGGREQQDSGQQGQQQDGSMTAGMLALHQAQWVMHQGMLQPAATAAVNVAPALAELIARHVRQLLVPDASSASSAQSREIMIALNNDLLPGTELWLSRTAKGWRLRADTRSTDAYRTLVDGAPQLIKRFADSNLGELDVDPSLLD